MSSQNLLFKKMNNSNLLGTTFKYSVPAKDSKESVYPQEHVIKNIDWHTGVVVKGDLYLSKNGNVHTTMNKSIAWIKLLGLGIELTIKGISLKILDLIKKTFNTKHSKEASHLLNLATISWKSVLCVGSDSIEERINQFAMAEIIYNSGGKIKKELTKPRSERLLKGTYYATCMHPLFNRIDYIESSKSLFAKRCEKYAFEAIHSQHGTCDNEKEIRCCGSRVGKKREFCSGALSIQECCGLTCIVSRCLPCCALVIGPKGICI